MGSGERIVLRLEPACIGLLAKLMEGYDGLGIVSTLDAAAGLVAVYVTLDTRREVEEILATLPFAVEVLGD
ncbi:MAG: DUF4911 domain-containing protein [Syntrophomonadaceae bacterium]|jgi:hypothetical protein|nr:DUF4911 domain-containing protein [Syntrophomonadaceae bacterium]MDH7497970.1 DUF4911 domain-containing protein [Syntrophomonadaceae bacterium]